MQDEKKSMKRLSIGGRLRSRLLPIAVVTGSLAALGGCPYTSFEQYIGQINVENNGQHEAIDGSQSDGGASDGSGQTGGSLPPAPDPCYSIEDTFEGIGVYVIGQSSGMGLPYCPIGDSRAPINLTLPNGQYVALEFRWMNTAHPIDILHFEVMPTSSLDEIVSWDPNDQEVFYQSGNSAVVHFNGEHFDRNGDGVISPVTVQVYNADDPLHTAELTFSPPR